MTPTNRQIAEHLLACYDTIYIVLGESAPTLSNDAYVVRTYESARAYGELALELREHLGEPAVTPIPVLDEVLRSAVAGDDSGALVLYAMAMVVGPRLLVSLLDARNALDGDARLTGFFNGASMVCVKRSERPARSPRTRRRSTTSSGRPGPATSRTPWIRRETLRVWASPGKVASARITRSTGISGVGYQGRAMAKDRVDRDDEDLVRLYLSDIGQYTLLTKDDEVRLAQTIEEGREAKAELDASETDKKIKLTPSKKLALKRSVHRGDQAERDFVQSNLRLVVSIAKKYQASGLPLLDLIQEGNLGLMHAVEKFDWRKGFKFSTYATWWIRQAITRGIANTGRTIRLPVHAGDTLARVQKAQSRLELKFGRPPTIKELCDECEMPEDKLIEALRFAPEPISLSEPLREDGDAELGDVVEDRSAESPFDVAAVKMMPAAIEKLLQPLDEREQKILRMRFGLDGAGEIRTFEDVGAEMNLTRERIRQIEARAMSKLRHPSSDTGARDLLTL